MSKEILAGSRPGSDGILPAGGLTPLAPEHLELINIHFQHGMDANKTAMALGVPVSTVIQTLQVPAVSAFVSTALLEQGYMNRSKLFSTLDDIVTKKLEEMEENEMGSNADILEILKVMHKMRMDEMAMQLKMQESEAKRNKTSINAGNVQVVNVNNPSGQSGNLGGLLNSLLKSNTNTTSEDFPKGNTIQGN